VESGSGNRDDYTGELKFSPQAQAEQDRAFGAFATAEGWREALTLMKFYIEYGAT
jgi:hypothetical protein